jgi:hypothetical protein
MAWKRKQGNYRWPLRLLQLLALLIHHWPIHPFAFFLKIILVVDGLMKWCHRKHTVDIKVSKHCWAGLPIKTASGPQLFTWRNWRPILTRMSRLVAIWTWKERRGEITSFSMCGLWNYSLLQKLMQTTHIVQIGVFGWNHSFEGHLGMWRIRKQDKKQNRCYTL